MDPIAATMPGDLVAPGLLWTADGVRGRPSPIPAQPGVYAWYFTSIPLGVPTAAANARVCWHVTSEPWLSETLLIGRLSLPLNLDQNAAGPFRGQLSALRAQCRATARALPVLRT